MQPFVGWNMAFVSNAGDKNFLIIILGLAYAVYFLSLGFKREAFLTLIALGSTVFSWVLKLLFRQNRPVTADIHFFLDYYSFPSSHTLTYTAFWGFMIYLIFKLTGIPVPLKILTIAFSIYFIGLVGVSRVYLGQHYIWDVIGGYVFGALFLVGLILIDKHLIK